MANNTDSIYLKMQIDTSSFDSSITGMKREMLKLKGLIGSNLLSPEENLLLKNRFGELKDQFSKLQKAAAATNIGADEAFGNMAQLGGVAAQAVAGVTGAMSLLGIESGKAGEVEKKILQFMAVGNALQSVADAKKYTGMIQIYALRVKDYFLSKSQLITSEAQLAKDEAQLVLQGKSNMAVKVAAAVQWAWNAALAANPIGLIVAGILALIAAITLLIVWYGNFSKAQDELNKKTEVSIKLREQQVSDLKKYNEALNTASITAQKTYIEETLKIDRLRKALNDNNLSRKQQLEALKQLKDETHIKTLTKENAAYGVVNKSIIQYLENIKLEAQGKALESVLIDQYTEQFKKSEELKTLYAVRGAEQRRKYALEELQKNDVGTPSAVPGTPNVESESYSNRRKQIEDINKGLAATNLAITMNIGSTKTLNNEVSNTTGEYDKLITNINKASLDEAKLSEDEANFWKSRRDYFIDAGLKRNEYNKKLLDGVREENKVKIEKLDAWNKAYFKVNGVGGLIDNEKIEEERKNKAYAENDLKLSKDVLDKKINAQKDYLNNKVLLLEQDLRNAKAAGKSTIEIETELNKTLEEIRKNRFNDTLNYANMVLQQFSDFANSIMSLNSERDQVLRDNALKALQDSTDETIKGLDDAYKYGVISLENYNAQKQAALEKQAAKEKEIKQQQYEQEKKQRIFQAVIGTAQAVVNALGSVAWPVNLVAAALTAALGAVQIAKIENMPVPSFAIGGPVMGKSHNKGGVPINAEGGEYIINKSVAQKPGMGSFLDKVNSGQISLTTINNSNNGIDIETMRSLIAEITMIPVINVESDITRVQRRVENIEAKAKW